MVLQLADPSVNHGFIFMEKPSFPKAVIVVVEGEAKHVVLVLDFFEVKSF